MSEATQVCTLCGQEKPLTEYHKQGSMRTGKSRRCKECVKVTNRKYRAKKKMRKPGIIDYCIPYY